MSKFLRLALCISLLAALSPNADAQSVPNPSSPISQGIVWTPAQWIQAFQSKQDFGGAALFTSGVVGNPTGGNLGAGTLNTQGLFVNGAPAGGLGAITDGSHTVNGATNLTVSGALVSGTAPNATLTITGGCTTNCTLTNPAISGGTISGAAVGATSVTASGGITDTSSAGISTTGPFKIGGAAVLSVGANSATTLGINAGAAMTGTQGLGNTFVGSVAGQSNTTGGENTFIGANSGQLHVSGTFNTAVGQHSFGHETSVSGTTAIGNDSQRNTVSASGFNTSLGKSAMYAGGSSQSTAIGAQALQGNGSVVAVAGTATAGDVLHLTFTGSFAGSPVSVSTVVTAGQSLNSMANALFNAVAANATLANSGTVDASGVTSGVDGATGNIIFRFIGTGTTGPGIVVTGSVTGAATETLTITNGSTGIDNIAIGYHAVLGNYLSTAARTVAIGDTTLPFLSSGSDNVVVGNSGAPFVSTSLQNVLIGSQAGGPLATGGGNVFAGFKVQASSASTNSAVVIGGNVNGGGVGAQGGSQSVVIGAQAGNAGLTGFGNVIIGFNVASTTLTTGVRNIIIGTSNAVDAVSSGASDTINIQNVFKTTATATPSASASTIAGTLTIGSISTGTPASFACFTSTGQLVSSATACP